VAYLLPNRRRDDEGDMERTRSYAGTDPVPTRAARYALRLPAWIRSRGSERWLPARTRNISHTGALLSTSERFAPGEAVDVVISVSDERHPERVFIVCRGTVERRRRSRGEAVVGVSLLAWRLDRTAALG
jgi:hypothetical protein